MSINYRKIENVCGLSDEARCDYFVRKVADFEVVWGLHDKGWATAETEGSVVVPFWPEEDFAALCAVDVWGGFSAKSIPLIEFISGWLPGLKSDRSLCLIFPAPNSRGIILPPERLKQLIEWEIGQYE